MTGKYQNGSDIHNENICGSLSGFIFELFKQLSLNLDDYADEVEKNDDWFAHMVSIFVSKQKNEFESIVLPVRRCSQKQNDASGDMEKKINYCTKNNFSTYEQENNISTCKPKSMIERMYGPTEEARKQKERLDTLYACIHKDIEKCFEGEKKYCIPLSYLTTPIYPGSFHFLYLIIDESWVNDKFTKIPGPNSPKKFCFASLLWFGLKKLVEAEPAHVEQRRGYWFPDLGGIPASYSKIIFEASAEVLNDFLYGPPASRAINDEKRMHTEATRITNRCENLGAYLLSLELFISISMQKYEQKECTAQIALCQTGQNLNNKCVLKLEDKVSLTDTRLVRKLMEATGKNSVLVCDGWYIIGITSNKGKDDESNKVEPLDKTKTIFIKFLSHMVWEAHYEDNLIFRFKEGGVTVGNQRNKPSARLNREPLASKVPEASREQVGKLIQAAIDACHGTTLLFTENAVGEAKRLKKDSTRVKPFYMEGDDLKSLSAIDGAVVFDFSCLCHAIGTILDGETCEEADSSRGARYNSAWRYYNFRKKTEDLFLVVISDDGMVDYICD